VEHIAHTSHMQVPERGCSDGKRAPGRYTCHFVIYVIRDIKICPCVSTVECPVKLNATCMQFVLFDLTRVRCDKTYIEPVALTDGVNLIKWQQ